MSEIWIFSDSVQSKVQQCLAVAPKNESNKWLQQFGRSNMNNNITNFSNGMEEFDQNNKGNLSPIVLSDEENPSEENKQIQHTQSLDLNNEIVEKICEYLETELENRFDDFIEDCLQHPKVLQKLANRLSTPIITKLCKNIYSKIDVNKTFLGYIFKFFFPAYIQREYNCITLDLLVQGSKLFPLEFQILIKEAAKNIEIPNKILQDYVKMLNENEQTKYLLILENLDLSSDEFIHNLFSIYTAYKSCIKTDCVQSYILSLLYDHSNNCTTDKNYGRLLLAYLQSIKSMGDNNKYDIIENIINTHRSPFKRPCLTIFNELKGCPQTYNDKDTDSD